VNRLCYLLLGFLAGPLAAQVRWNAVLRQPAEWYATAEARAIADSVLLYQTAEDGWPKNTDMTAPPTAEYLAAIHSDHPGATIDNGGTTTQIAFLARVVTATNGERHRAAVLHGLDYPLVSQYENGGWPQFYPLRPGYYTRSTYTDNAMIDVLGILRDVRDARPPFAWVDIARRKGAELAVERAIGCILRTQCRRAGKLTAWCAQHDETTLAPAWARNFEPPSLSGAESVGLVRVLMAVENPTPEIIAAVVGAVAWFEAVKVRGLRVETFSNAEGQRDRRTVSDPDAPDLWARFYELDTDRPIFTGRDRVIRYDFNEIERERRAGYTYLGTWPDDLLAKEYPRWRAKHQLP